MSSVRKQIHEDQILKVFFENYDYIKDPRYSEWETQLYSENNKFTFERTLDFCKINWKFKDDWKQSTKNKWLKFIRKWNMIRYEKDSVDNTEMSIVGYAAVTYLYIVLPYDLLEHSSERCTEITEFHAKLINICMLHETGENFLCFKDYDMLTTKDPPHHPSTFEQYLDEQYNSASWFLTFLIYISSNNTILGHKGAIWN